MPEADGPRRIPVLIDFDWQRPETIATYDEQTGVLTMKVRPDSRLESLLTGTSDDAELRTLSFGYSLRRVHCLARYEPGEPDQNTHTCDLGPGHEGRHRCPLCRSFWKVKKIDA